MFLRISRILLLASLPLFALAQLTPQNAVLLMQKGINLGNTLEPPLEGGWNNPPAQEYYFDLYRDAGFRCIRVPVRWDGHTLDVPPYSIDGSWLQRVEQIVDWGLDRGLFIIINAHHDDWIKQGYENAGNRARFDSIWSQVSVRFRNKPENLLFEVLNEPYGLTREQNNEMHARILSIIRKANPTRIVIFQGHNWGGSDELKTMAIPDDPYIIGSFHSYDPYSFGLLGEGTWGSAADINVLNYKFAGVKTWSEQNQIPVILGEFGSLKSCDYNSRMKHYRTYVELSQKNGFAYCAWDDGGEIPVLEREAREWDEVKDILIHTTSLAPKNLNLKILQDTLVQLYWSNVSPGQDTIFIERRNTGGEYAVIGTLPGDSSVFCDSFPVRLAFNHYRVIARLNTGIDLYSQPMRIMMPAYEPKIRKPYSGLPSLIPGNIEAEDYDTGGEGFTYHDADLMNIPGDYRPGESVDIYSRPGGGFHIGNALPGEWYEYTVVVEQAGPYRADFHLAALQGGGTFSYRIGETESGIVTAPGTGSWLTTATVSDTVNLEAGEQIMRFTVISLPLFNIDRFVFTPLIPSGIPGDQPVLPKAFVDHDRAIVVDLPEGTGSCRISIYSLTGSLLHSEPATGPCHRMATTGIPPGLYILRMETRSPLYNLKIPLP